MSAKRTASDDPGARERLLDAAIALFAERGYAATGTSAICERAGLAKTALYWHFESKEGLLAAVIEAVGNGWIERLRKLAYLQGDPEERLAALLRGWRELAREEPQLLLLPMVAQLEQADSTRVREALEELLRRAQEALVQGIEDSLGRSLPDLDLVARTAITLLQGAVLQQTTSPDAGQFDRALDELRRIIELQIWARLPQDEQAAIFAARRSGGLPRVGPDEAD